MEAGKVENLYNLLNFLSRQLNLSQRKTYRLQDEQAFPSKELG